MPSKLRRLTGLAAFVLIATALLVASPARAGGTDHAVEIVDFAFSPATLTITAGDTVTWTNGDPIVHTATSTTGAWDSGDLEQGESYSFTFTEPGTHDYLCTPHPSMTGRIVVVAAASTPAPTVPASPAAGGGGTLPDVAMDRAVANIPLVVGIGLILGAAALSAVRWRRRAP
jgi:plastocyanin